MSNRRRNEALARALSVGCVAACSAALLALNSGCSTVSVQRLEPASAILRPASHVVVLNELPSGPYRGIARIEVRDHGLGRSAATLRKKLLAAAARLGADAVVLDPPSSPRKLFVAPGVVSMYDDLVISGLAILRGSPPDRPDTSDDRMPDPPSQRQHPGAGSRAGAGLIRR